MADFDPAPARRVKKVIPWFVPRHLKCVVNNANVGDEEILQNGP